MEKKKSIFDVDLINGPIFKSIVVFTIPIFISYIFQMLYNTVDTMIVGNYLGDNSLAAIGASSVVYELLVGFALGIGGGLTIITARYFGSGDMDKVKKSVVACGVIGLVVSVVVTIVGEIVLYPLLKLLNTPAEILDESYSYVSTIVLFIIVMFIYNMTSSILRAIGNSVMPLVFLVFSSILNIFLDIFFIVKVGMGVKGAAVATVIAQAISAVLSIIYIFIRVKVLVPSKEHFKPEGDMYKEMIAQGLSMGFMGSIVSIGTVILQYGINGLGTLTIAAHTAARKLYSFGCMPFITSGMAMMTFASQNLGAKKPERVREALKKLFIFDVVIVAFICVIHFTCSRFLMTWISGSSEATVINLGTLYLKIVAPCYLILAVLLQSRYTLQGLGAKIIPLVSSCIELVGKIIFVLFFIDRFGYYAVIACEPVIWTFMTVQLLWSLAHNPNLKTAKQNQ